MTDSYSSLIEDLGGEFGDGKATKADFLQYVQNLEIDERRRALYQLASTLFGDIYCRDNLEDFNFLNYREALDLTAKLIRPYFTYTQTEGMTPQSAKNQNWNLASKAFESVKGKIEACLVKYDGSNPVLVDTFVFSGVPYQFVISYYEKLGWSVKRDSGGMVGSWLSFTERPVHSPPENRCPVPGFD